MARINIEKLHALADLNRRCDAALKGNINTDSMARKKESDRIKRYEESAELVRIMEQDQEFAGIIAQAIEEGIKTKARKNAIEMTLLINKINSTPDSEPTDDNEPDDETERGEQ